MFPTGLAAAEFPLLLDTPEPSFRQPQCLSTPAQSAVVAITTPTQRPGEQERLFRRRPRHSTKHPAHVPRTSPIARQYQPMTSQSNRAGDETPGTVLLRGCPGKWLFVRSVHRGLNRPLDGHMAPAYAAVFFSCLLGALVVGCGV